MRAIQVTRTGGPEVLVPADVSEPVAGPGQLLVEVTAAGVNFADTHRTEGTYLLDQTFPYVPGTEVVGFDGDRRLLGWTVDGAGGYAERALVAGETAVPVPDTVTDGAALALLVQGLTAWHLLTNSARLRDGESVVVNAAAGGVGSLAVQLARQFGAGRVIAAASSPAKRELALDLGADAAVDSAPDGYADRVRAANHGRPVDIVLDATGGPGFTAGLAVLADFGRLVTFGNASRADRPSIDPAVLTELNATVAGFWLRPLLGHPEHYTRPLGELLRLTAAGRLRPVLGGEYPLADARRAHEDLLARRTTGKLVLDPARTR
ncbi:zinc-binding dehydrogenase [Longispora sp. NPDC051575]|uniref:quinone oxidoreductase family protein n=1 Tax=Longispora sp. NPDC051575 TaxID=3154943 RepID=UPI003446B275